MKRIDAAAIPAKMIQVQAARHLADPPFIDDNVCRAPDGAAVRLISDYSHAITILERAGPLGAS